MRHVFYRGSPSHSGYVGQSYHQTPPPTQVFCYVFVAGIITVTFSLNMHSRSPYILCNLFTVVIQPFQSMMCENFVCLLATTKPKVSVS